MRTQPSLASRAGLVAALMLAACTGDSVEDGATPGTGATTSATSATGPTAATGPSADTGPTGVTLPGHTGVDVDLGAYPACGLITPDELGELTAMDWVNTEQPPASPDQPFCSWDSSLDPNERARLQISVVPRSEFGTCTLSPTAEKLPGLGDRAVIDLQARRLCVLSGDRYLSIFLTFFPEREDYRTVVIAVAEVTLPRIDEVPG